MQRLDPQTKTVRKAISLPEDVAKRVQALADKKQVSYAEMMRRLLAKALA